MSNEIQNDLPAAINPIDEDVSWDESYELVVYNDSETPIEFVVELLMAHFLILQNEATSFAIRVHTNGQAGIGRLTQQAAQGVKNSILMRTNQCGAPLRIEVSRWSKSRAITD